MDNQKPNYYSIIPAEVRYDNDLRANEKLLYSEITSLMNKDGYCYATNKYFANLYDVSVQSISKWINNLIEKGYIVSEIVYKENSNEIQYRKLSTVLNKSLIPIKQKFNTPIKQKFNVNNINNRIINKNNIINNNLYDIYENKIGSLNSNQYQIIENFRDILSDELIIKAIDISVENNVKSFNYFKAILDDFKNKGYKYIDDIKKSLKTYSKRVIEEPSWLMNDNIKSEEVDIDTLCQLEEDFKIFT